MPVRRCALVAALARCGPATAVVAALAVCVPAGAAPPSWLQVHDGVSRPQFALADAIEQTVFVETRIDSDRDGRRDRIRIRIRRPGNADPVIFELSPYRGRLGNAENHDVDLGALPRADLPGRLDDHYVPRGYAVVLGESIGTGGSTGCPDVGGRAEELGTRP